MMSENESLFIDNQWKRGTGTLFSSQNPANGETLWQGREGAPSDINEAIISAKQAFGSWAALSIDERSRFLINFAAILRSSHRELAETISKETGKPLWDSLNEVEGMINKVNISIEAYRQRCVETIRNQPYSRLITRHRPHGVVAVFGPYNFPAHLPNGHIIPALLAGNTLVFKPSEFTPLVAEQTLRLWQKVGLPPGVLNLVQGGRETGKALAHHPELQGIFFTGSCSTGLYLSQSLGSQLSKIIALELGGNNPLVVGSITDFRAAAYMILQSAFLSTGQRCTCARRLIIPDTQIGENVLIALMGMMGSLSIGPYTQKPEPFMGPVISEKHAKQIIDSQAFLKSKGGKVLIEMRHLKRGTGFVSPGLMDVSTIKERPDEEIFGPFLQVIRVHDLQEAIHEANQTKFGLTAGLLSQKQEEYDNFIQQIQAGIINWNAPLTGASSMAPFGGIKSSGNYRPSGFYTADYCSYPVASTETPDLKIPSIVSPGILNL